MNEYNYDFSVMMITYNHESFIEQSVRSALSQRFDKRLEVVIGVDKSSDRTLELCLQLKEEFPDIIKLIIHKESAGMFGNFYATLEACSGKYISILEGDDFWIDENKLQTQYDFFEHHPACILSAGHVTVVDENGHSIERDARLPERGEVLKKEDVIIINQLNTLTTAFRRKAVNWKALRQLSTAPHLDWSFYISLQYPEGGFIYKFNKVFGAYRKHSGGVYSLVDNEKKYQNILKSICSIHELDIESRYKDYLKSLFSNFSLKLNNKEVLKEKPYNSLFDPGLIIYTPKGKLKLSYIRSLYKATFLFLLKRKRESLKLAWELFRQTRLFKKNYLNVFLLPVFPVVFVMNKRELAAKTNLINNAEKWR